MKKKKKHNFLLSLIWYFETLLCLGKHEFSGRVTKGKRFIENVEICINK